MLKLPNDCWLALILPCGLAWLQIPYHLGKEIVKILTKDAAMKPLSQYTLLSLLSLILLLMACGSEVEPPPTSPPKSHTMVPTSRAALPYDEQTLTMGQINYSIFCISCHGPDAKGLPDQGLDLTASQLLHKSTDEELLQFVIQGRPIDHPDNTTGVEMPPRAGFPNLEDAQILTIIAYLRSLAE
jgi:mono/diheme cytochrome c family protein